MTNEIQNLIDDREAKIEKKQAEIDLLKAEVKALREAQDAVGGKTPKKSGTRERALTAKWSAVLNYVGGCGKASYNEILKFAEQEGLKINNNALRGQMSIYSDKGWIRRVSDGVFELTESGAEKCGYEEKSLPQPPTAIEYATRAIAEAIENAVPANGTQKNEAPEGASNVGEAATSPNINEPTQGHQQKGGGYGSF